MSDELKPDITAPFSPVNPPIPEETSQPAPAPLEPVQAADTSVPPKPVAPPAAPPTAPPAEPKSTPDQEQPSAPVNAPGTQVIDVEKRVGSDTDTGKTLQLSWGARSDVGLIREHNEDSFLVHAPLFCVCDGMGGHAAGEVASAIAVRSIAEHAPAVADDILLGASIELANTAIIDGAQQGVGKPGMGCTATAAILENNRLAIAHVGDSRLYVLHEGTLVRVTHDHSFVEELIDAGEITADEARSHPSRSVITRALGSDPNMYADHFTLDIEKGDRIIICSDGLSSMVSDSTIEDLAVSSATPQQAADNLVAEALAEGGHDNVTVIVVDVTNGDSAIFRRHARRRALITWLIAILVPIMLLTVSAWLVVQNSWYIGTNGTTVAIYQGVNSAPFGYKLSTLSETTSIKVADLPETTQHLLEEGISVSGPEAARKTVEDYRDQITKEKDEAASKLDTVKDQDAQTTSKEGD
ncbi:MAG: Stp1/IreP family PP2C-type Ser/Thr phosphatase [Atopobium sp.]|uniref:Stp1/IreP family PP2C-type Ser/Thr phosphatase n=1 Tax=Atopobium sp. TaxID=1872650 RepID=UPI002A75F035|nr:Stp1/IreP family PP2C-type Ser/Thr phosphatase [Atopobium sp.]MDY2788097.1 Stp1/IreP family PP2C-type Ser/Thr phosphatase [Atopobium sp.]